MSKTKKSTLYVSGMHCASCEVLIEKKLKAMKGVHDVTASLADKKVVCTYESQAPNVNALNREFADLGYTFSKTDTNTATFSMQSVMTAVLVGIVMIVLFLILQDTNILSSAVVTESSSIGAFFILGVVASLSTCAALVGGLLLSLSKQWNSIYGGNNDQERIKPFVMFNIGRLISYALLGAVLGLIGSVFTISLQFTSLLVLIVSLIMVILGLQMLGVPFAKKIRLTAPRFISSYISDEQNFQGKYMPFLVGALTFFIPCGFTLMAQTVALTSGNPFKSMLMMTAFALGTLPVLAVLSFTSIKFQKNSLYAGTFNLIVGLFVIGFGIYSINSQLNVLGVPSLSDMTYIFTKTISKNEGQQANIIQENGQKYQELHLTAEGFSYTPRAVTLKVNVPVKLTVTNKNVVGCAQAMYMPGLYDQVIYLTGSETHAEFTPRKIGSYKISCTMGMVQPVLVTVTN